MQLFSKSKNGKMLKIGTTAVDAKWYFMTDAVAKTADQFNVGDNITITTSIQQGSAFVTDIKSSGATSVSAPAPVSTGSTYDAGNSFQDTTATQTSAKTPYLPRAEWEAKMKAEGKWKSGDSYSGNDKGVDVNSSIKRQAIGHMTSRTLIGMQGIVTPENVEALMEQIYNKYVELVG